MRCMMLMKSDERTEQSEMPDEQVLAALGKFNEPMVAAGVMLTGEGRYPTARGTRVRLVKSRSAS